MPPMAVFDRKILKAELKMDEVPETIIYALTDNGWSNSEVFDYGFTIIFLAYTPTARPLLLMMDGHSSHYNPSTIKIASAQQVILFCLPPHTTHMAQPLDVGCFGVLKKYWGEECHDYNIVNNPCAWARAMVPKNICAGFRATGVYPLDSTVFTARCATQDSNSSPSSTSTLKLCQCTAQSLHSGVDLQGHLQVKRRNSSNRDMRMVMIYQMT